jgi:hypothetical protein
MDVDDAFKTVRQELDHALFKFSRFNSYHEGWAVIKEEVDELWEEVRRKPYARCEGALRAEAIQTAAMAIRFVMELT